MATSKGIKSVKRFGSRYGRTVRHKFGKIEAQQRRAYKCPYCNKKAVKRIAIGIWQCKKCNVKFTDQAYTTTKKKEGY
ncbi:50S ribosomal protein L37ae [Candidatus Woesearchaeota archaeon]|nr:MAG: 50S ribosomal protein L37ae [Candidatus Woesearchaeota archaeon]